jgi:NADH-quinone oxidoreductase subunit G
MEKLTVKIDGVELKVEKGTTVLEAAKMINKLIPTFCYHEKLPIFGGCRMCLVYDVKAKRSIIACGSYVYDGMEIETENQQVINDRKFILEMLFTRHPLDCPICDKAGECDLQNWGTYWGPQNNVLPITPFEKIRPEDDWESDYLEYVSNRCVLCIKCVSVCDNINQSHSLFQLERGFETLISPVIKPMDSSSCEMCGLCVDVCPVGAILFKPFKFNARPWLLNETYTHCSMCSLGCPVVIDHDGKKIYRIRSTAELEICSKPYLGYDAFNTNRLKFPKVKGQNTSFENALKEVAEIVNQNPEKTAIVVSPYLSNEVLQVINEFGLYTTSIITIDILPLLEGFGDYTPLEYDEIKDANHYIIIGDDITQTNPVLTYYIRKKVVYIGEELGRIKKLYPYFIQAKGKEIIERLKENAQKGSVIIYSSYFIGEDAKYLGQVLRNLQDEKGCKVVIAPPYSNAFGIVNNIKNISSFIKTVEKVFSGEIENLILIGEEISLVIQEEKLKKIFDKLKNKIVFTPFEDGLAFVGDIVIPLNTWVEEDGFYDFSTYQKKVKASIKNNFKNTEIFGKLKDLVKSKNKQVEKVEADYITTDWIERFKQDIWDASYFSLRSENLTNWKLKNQGVLNEY